MDRNLEIPLSLHVDDPNHVATIDCISMSKVLLSYANEKEFEKILRECVVKAIDSGKGKVENGCLIFDGHWE